MIVEELLIVLDDGHWKHSCLVKLWVVAFLKTTWEGVLCHSHTHPSTLSKAFNVNIHVRVPLTHYQLDKSFAYRNNILS